MRLDALLHDEIRALIVAAGSPRIVLVVVGFHISVMAKENVYPVCFRLHSSAIPPRAHGFNDRKLG